MMFDRRLIGDVAIAVLIAVPSASLAHADGTIHAKSTAAAQSSVNSPNTAIAPHRHVGLFR